MTHPPSAESPVAAARRPSVEVAVVMERERAPNRWEDWRFRVVEVVEQQSAFGMAPRTLLDDGRLTRRLFPGLRLELFRDEGEGYHLNLTSGAPAWFVVWRLDEGAQPCDTCFGAHPETVSLSYNEAGRWLDAQEHVESVPLPPHLVAWLADYTQAHYRPEPKERRRPASFRTPSQRGADTPAKGDPR